MKIMTESLKEMSPDDLKKMVEEAGLKTTNFTPQAVTVALQAAINMGGFAAYQVTVIVANSIAKALLGHGLQFAANTALTRSLGVLAGPVGMTMVGAWTLGRYCWPRLSYYYSCRRSGVFFACAPATK